MRRSLVLILLLGLLLPACSESGGRIVVGSKNFTEQVILGELLAQQIESRLDVPVDRRLNLAGTFICHHALTSGEIDLYVEYTGTAYTAILEHESISDPEAVLQRVRQEYAELFDVEWMEPLGFNNSFAVMVRGDVARKLGLRTISQVAEYTANWRPGFGYEFLGRVDGLNGLKATYGLEFAEAPREMDIGLMYRALESGQVDLIAGNSTDGLVAKLDLTILEDDRNFFPPYHAVPVVRRDSLKRVPGLSDALRDLGGTITVEAMRQMNYAVDGEGRSVRDVVQQHLRSTANEEVEAPRP